MEKQLTNSDPLRELTRNHSIYQYFGHFLSERG
jgi:hypothetical protein